MKDEILRMQNVSKSKNGVKHLDNINFHIFKGEIMGIIPLNNHGKEELLDLVVQNKNIDFGRIFFNEKMVNYYEYSDLSYNDVYIIDKKSRLIEDLTVIDNICVLNNKFSEYLIDEKKIEEKTNQILLNLGISMDIKKRVYKLTIYEKIIVELVRAVINGCRLIILNEISNFLALDELYRFQKLVNNYTKKGLSFIYMANHHEEAFKICNRVCLLKNGSIIKVIYEEDFSDEIIEPYTIDFDSSTGIKSLGGDRTGFEFRNFSSNNLSGASFSVDKGECITILALDNRGIDDIELVLQGLLDYDKGNVYLEGEEIVTLNIVNLLSNSIVFIPENPIEKYLFFDMTYMENLTFLIQDDYISDTDKNERLYYLKDKYFNSLYISMEDKGIEDLSIKELYELVYFRVLLSKPKVVFISQPFSNSDMYLRARIIKLINIFKQEGVAVIILAVNLSDTLNVSDRLLIMEEGKISKEYNKDNLFNNK